MKVEVIVGGIPGPFEMEDFLDPVRNHIPDHTAYWAEGQWQGRHEASYVFLYVGDNDAKIDIFIDCLQQAAFEWGEESILIIKSEAETYLLSTDQPDRPEDFLDYLKEHYDETSSH